MTRSSELSLRNSNKRKRVTRVPVTRVITFFMKLVREIFLVQDSQQENLSLTLTFASSTVDSCFFSLYINIGTKIISCNRFLFCFVFSTGLHSTVRRLCAKLQLRAVAKGVVGGLISLPSKTF